MVSDRLRLGVTKPEVRVETTQFNLKKWGNGKEKSKHA